MKTKESPAVSSIGRHLPIMYSSKGYMDEIEIYNLHNETVIVSTNRSFARNGNTIPPQQPLLHNTDTSLLSPGIEFHPIEGIIGGEHDEYLIGRKGYSSAKESILILRTDTLNQLQEIDLGTTCGSFVWSNGRLVHIHKGVFTFYEQQ